MKNSIFWDITLCSLLKVNWRFRGICCPHFQDSWESQVGNQHEADRKRSFLSMDYTVLHPRRFYFSLEYFCFSTWLYMQLGGISMAAIWHSLVNQNGGISIFEQQMWILSVTGKECESGTMIKLKWKNTNYAKGIFWRCVSYEQLIEKLKSQMISYLIY
jgi:hypothetical protein